MRTRMFDVSRTRTTSRVLSVLCCPILCRAFFVWGRPLMAGSASSCYIHSFIVEWSRPKRQKPPPLGGRSLRPFRLNFVPSDSGCSPVGILNGKKGGCDWAQTKPGEPFLPTGSYSGCVKSV